MKIGIETPEKLTETDLEAIISKVTKANGSRYEPDMLISF